jgi:hypothetical protein
LSSNVIGFVLLTHNKPAQIIRLLKTLNYMFNWPPIAWHHDFTQCTLPPEAFTQNVSLVRPHLRTGWGRFSVIDAMLKALELLFELSDPPRWFVLLSGADYPIRSADNILSDLRSSPYDAHINHEDILYKRYQRAWHEECYNRYCVKKFSIPFVSRRVNLTYRTLTLRNPWLSAPFIPFSRDFHCFAGEHWFSANSEAAKLILDYHKTKLSLATHYRQLETFGTIVPEESYYQTILGNQRKLKVSQNSLRYVVWSEDGVGPKILGLEDLDNMLASSAHFARKFDMEEDSAVLDKLDAIIR